LHAMSELDSGRPEQVAINSSVVAKEAFNHVFGRCWPRINIRKII
jgi:hypothetical protein